MPAKLTLFMQDVEILSGLFAASPRGTFIAVGRKSPALKNLRAALPDPTRRRKEERTRITLGKPKRKGQKTTHWGKSKWQRRKSKADELTIGVGRAVVRVIRAKKAETRRTNLMLEVGLGGKRG